MINKKRLEKTFLNLVQINSPSKKEKDLNSYLKKYLKPLTSSVYEDNTAKKINGNSGNLIFTIKGNTQNIKPLSFWAHMDTVAPTSTIVPISTKDRIKTNGKTILGADDKAAVAALCEVASIIKEKKVAHGDIEFVFTVAEEIGLLGAKHIELKKLKSKLAYVLDCDGSLGTIIIAAPMSKSIQIAITGKAAHAGIEPQKGKSAIAAASMAISQMKLGKINNQTTANIGTISGGTAINIIPETTCLSGECRSFNKTQLDAQIKHMKQCFEKAKKKYKIQYRFETALEYYNFAIKQNEPVFKLAKRAIKKLQFPLTQKKSGGGSDANVLNKNNISALNLGIGMQNAHTKNEFILKEDLSKTAALVLEIINQHTNE